MYGRKRSILLGGLLSLLAVLYGIAIRLRTACYRFGVFRVRKLPCRVISVGNITVGGTGKTPAVIQIARLVKRSGGYPAVVSRGYGRRNESRIVIASDGRNRISDTSLTGDEPGLIAKRLPEVPVVVGNDRYQTALFTKQIFGSDSIILDDGFQHIQLQRDLDIVLIDAVEPFGNGRLFPAGILRERRSALKRADAVFITRVDGTSDLASLKTAIQQSTKAPIFTAHHQPVELIETKTGETKPLSALAGTSILAFSGIAKPASFLSILSSLHAVVRAELVYPDHYSYTKADLADIYQRAGNADAALIVTTEKDAVRLTNFNLEGIWALRIEISVNEKKEWERMILNGIRA